MSFLNMKGAKTVSNTRSTPLRPSKLRNEIANASSTAPRNDGTPTKSAKLQKPPPVKGTFKPAPKPVQGDHGSLWLERSVMVKPNGTAAVPSSKPRPSTSTSNAAKTSSSPSPSRGTPTYVSPELRSAEHPASRARMSDLFSAAGSSATGHDNSQSDSAAVIAQSRPRLKTLREVGSLGAPKADGRMEPNRLKRYVPDVVSTVTSAYSSGDNWVSTIDKFNHLATVFEESGSDTGSDFLPSFLKLESDSGSSGTLITRASSGVLPADEMAARIKPKDKATVRIFYLDQSPAYPHRIN
ncbi:hypothetical protein PENSPDRAFT_503234 [Peniophora sp. CONT]|nr:hypothetical protein PENSPDRAFT_503234 [Peniophora sp. CONT]